MKEFDINEMLDMQRSLQEKYKDKWEKISPEAGKHKLLWMIGEIGEVIDIVKKYGDDKACDEAGEREHLIEELADVLVYCQDLLDKLGLDEDEIINMKMDQNAAKYPVEKAKGKADKYDAL